MDAINRQILELLQRNARSPVKVIAAHVGLARSSVRERISKMEAAGVIRGYRVELGDAARSRSDVEAYLFLALATTPDPGMVKTVCDHPGVVSCCSVGGVLDLIVHVRVGNTAELNQLRDALSADVRVRSLTTNLILKRDK